LKGVLLTLLDRPCDNGEPRHSARLRRCKEQV
jgi:hypothetical protein